MCPTPSKCQDPELAKFKSCHFSMGPGLPLALSLTLPGAKNGRLKKSAVLGVESMCAHSGTCGPRKRFVVLISQFPGGNCGQLAHPR